jgi:RNA polymerase sigma-B factor
LGAVFAPFFIRITYSEDRLVKLKVDETESKQDACLMVDETEQAGLEELELFRAYRANPSAHNEECLLKKFEKLVFRIIRDFNVGVTDVEDVKQVGQAGLLLAIRRYDPESKFRFSTFAWPTIRGEIQRYFRDKRWTVKVPRKLKETSQRVFSVQALLAAKLGQEPTAKDIAEETGMSEEAIIEAMELGSAYSPKSFYDNVDDDEYGQYVSSSQVVEKENEELRKNMFWDSMFSHLKPVEAEVLRMRFLDGMTQREVAEILETSQMCISRIQRIALGKLRQIASEFDLEDLE